MDVNNIDGVNLTLLRVYVQKAMPDMLMFRDSVELRAYRDMLLNSMIYELRALVSAEKLQETKHTFTAEWPTTWWDAFKLEKFPSWLLKLFPANMKAKNETVEWERYAIYPKMTRFLPKECEDWVAREITSVKSSNEEK